MTNTDQKYIENPEFLKWIFNNNPTTNSYWEKYLKDNPNEKMQILELKAGLSELKFENEFLPSDEKEELAAKVLHQVDLYRKRKGQRIFFISFLKYAAIIILSATIGGLFVYLNSDRESAFQQFASQMIQVPASNQGPVLITSNGDNVDLKKSNSTVDYSQNGKIVLNNDSMISASVDIPNVMNQLVIPYGNQSKIVLSDGTIVWLNAGSRLIYPTLFADKIREVFLVGEAFFEVSKNPEKPFVVKTSDLEIKVLGTKFNISAYAEDNVIQTVLKEGSVEIRRSNAAYFEKGLVLKPNQMAFFNKTLKDTKVYEVDADYYMFWTQGLLSFDEIDFNRIVKKVERFYNISIRFSEATLGSIRISGKLDLKQNRREVLEYLEKVSVTKIEKLNDNQYIVKK